MMVTLQLAKLVHKTSLKHSNHGLLKFYVLFNKPVTPTHSSQTLRQQTAYHRYEIDGLKLECVFLVSLVQK